ncbi:MAG: ABC transporter permease [Armatimonadota bacterium]|nr:ABC transporter permease [Armatimonadota bacterium]MDR7454817.1 ABC transporter permease [Armatimonadota bacterium]MDR7457616.1 ABC transporter permease [Armatimonadota bacterium]MDR7510436.1 ABC transporter permease [Armatimonadota bacterium]
MTIAATVRPGRPGLWRRDGALYLWRGGLLVAILALWELAGRYWVNPVFLSPPSVVAGRLVAMRADLLRHTVITLQEVLSGFAIAAAWGILAGYVLGANRTVERVVEPFLAAFYAVPIIAIAPLLILVFGLGTRSKVATAAIYAGLPIVVNVVTGIKNVDGVLVKAVRSLGAGRAQIFLKVTLPASLPYLLAGLRLGFTLALIAVIVSQMLAAYAGLGWLVAYAAGTFRTPDLYVGLVALGVLGMIANEGLRRLEYRLMRWHYERGR